MWVLGIALQNLGHTKNCWQVMPTDHETFEIQPYFYCTTVLNRADIKMLLFSFIIMKPAGWAMAEICYPSPYSFSSCWTMNVSSGRGRKRRS